LPTSQGAFYDLMGVNEEMPCRDSTYAFLRYHHDAPDPQHPDSNIRGLLIWIIGMRFDAPHQEMSIRIPGHALETMGLTNEQRYNFEPLPTLPGEKQNLLVSQLNSPGVKITTGYAGYAILQAFFPW
jgi:hypothetical protein